MSTATAVTATDYRTEIFGFARIECYQCHVPFLVTTTHKQKLLDTGNQFWCPNGHAQHYSTSNLARLQQELEAKKAEAERIRSTLQSTHEQLRAAREERDHHWTERKKLKTRHTHLRQRVKHGVCPVCQRTVGALARHMADKHPDFAHGEVEAHPPICGITPHPAPVRAKRRGTAVAKA